MNALAVLRWILRAVVVLQCLGHARWFLRMEAIPIAPTPLLSFLLEPRDTGGLALPESTGVLIERIIGWCLLAAAGWTLLRPCWPVLAPLAALQVTLACCMMRMDVGFSPTWALPSHALRIAAPLALALVAARRARPGRASPTDAGLGPAEPLMRWAAALTFLGHGLDAWWQSPRFQNLISATALGWFGILPEQTNVETCLRMIGAVDLTAALLVVLVRWPIVAGWMGFWGLVTAISRVTAFGFLPQYHEVLIRAAHYGIPTALALYWTRRAAWCAPSAGTPSPKDPPQPPKELPDEVVRTR